MKSIATYALKFFGYIISVLASVYPHQKKVFGVTMMDENDLYVPHCPDKCFHLRTIGRYFAEVTEVKTWNLSLKKQMSFINIYL